MIFTDYNLQEATDGNSLSSLLMEVKNLTALFVHCTYQKPLYVWDNNGSVGLDWLTEWMKFSSLILIWLYKRRWVDKGVLWSKSLFSIKALCSAPIQSTGCFQTEICAIYAILLMFHLLQTSATLTACLWFALWTEYAKAGYIVHSARNFIQGMF